MAVFPPEVAAPAAATAPGPAGEFPAGPATAGLLAQVERAAASDLPVLLEGESGVGKSLLVRALHALSPRAGRPLVTVPARSLAADGFERDLFGELAGEASCPPGQGLAAQADGGILLLEEVEDLPAESQAKLVRFLDAPLLRPAGAGEARPVDVRIVSTSRRELRGEVAAGRFRADLYYRLRGILLRVPSLRERREDLPAVADYLLRRVAGRQGKRLAGFRPDALALLAAQPFPGNLRELEAAVERAVARTPEGGQVGLEALLPADPRAAEPAGAGLRQLRREHEREMVAAALEARGWNVSAAARDLGISRVGLCKKIKVLGLARPPRSPGRTTPPRAL